MRPAACGDTARFVHDTHREASLPLNMKTRWKLWGHPEPPPCVTNETAEKRSDPDTSPLSLEHAAFLEDAQRMLRWNGSSRPAQAAPQAQAGNECSEYYCRIDWNPSREHWLHSVGFHAIEDIDQVWFRGDAKWFTLYQFFCKLIISFIYLLWCQHYHYGLNTMVPHTHTLTHTFPARDRKYRNSI